MPVVPADVFLKSVYFATDVGSSLSLFLSSFEVITYSDNLDVTDSIGLAPRAQAT